MDQAQIATLLYTVVLGLLILWSYLMFLGGLDKERRAEAWAVFATNPALFYTWCVTAALAALGFLAFLGWYFAMTNDGSVYFTHTWVPVSLFLSFSLVYAPSLFFEYSTLVIAALMGAALSAVVLAVFAFHLFGALHPAFVGTLLLAGHCAVMDVGVWGGTWRAAA